MLPVFGAHSVASWPIRTAERQGNSPPPSPSSFRLGLVNLSAWRGLPDSQLFLVYEAAASPLPPLPRREAGPDVDRHPAEQEDPVHIFVGLPLRIPSRAPRVTESSTDRPPPSPPTRSPPRRHQLSRGGARERGRRRCLFSLPVAHKEQSLPDNRETINTCKQNTADLDPLQRSRAVRRTSREADCGGGAEDGAKARTPSHPFLPFVPSRMGGSRKVAGCDVVFGVVGEERTGGTRNCVLIFLGVAVICVDAEMGSANIANKFVENFGSNLANVAIGGTASDLAGTAGPVWMSRMRIWTWTW
ncbi:hypothetical protein BDK51DRAFT_50318 [Blyttiomyces helicus]|uniref:Uncharacterized protein n=1 Tax=Blyttiomyces helicus TaxID=388810 RepID=A0A4P9W8M4_9FUNG|nr:hypothetical protein BDK51DRAFT_50318 [Blyttiomyces helicus]|eukprot:RKO87813.1 hypothetical protein BDK51DRAFT_50318 [Blyttiomyces helicus]